MSITNINNNTAQLYTQEKPATASLKQQSNQAAATAAAPTTDSVQISERAKALLAKETAVATFGNGEGIEPPKTISGNGEGIEPPKTVSGNGEGIEPPKTISGNGEGIEPPKT
ncbi:hypothetical protein [Rheinheimera sp.]|uniref:hypothetical protein n=1 Tax=Rheinheimera sp. TaxID=1869214 RepID=UPI0027323A25|nr:hypothetical protein [Rheinheimera sp.]MDP2715375.1 hypothetical protein [Rheinheimera sp.]